MAEKLVQDVEHKRFLLEEHNIEIFPNQYVMYDGGSGDEESIYKGKIDAITTRTVGGVSRTFVVITWSERYNKTRLRNEVPSEEVPIAGDNKHDIDVRDFELYDVADDDAMLGAPKNFVV